MKELNIKKLQCVVMAGGLGTRLGKITKNVPKPLVNINGKPFIYFLLKSLISKGLKNFLIIVSYKKDLIINYINKDFKKEIKFKFFHDKDRRGTYNAIIKSKMNLKKEFLYCNADEIIDVNLKKFYNEFKMKKFHTLCTIIKSKKGYLNCNRSKKIIKEYSLDQGNYIETGLKLINRKIIERNGKYIKLEEFLYKKLIKKNKLGYYKILKMPLRIDTLKDLKIAKKKLYFKV